MGNDYYILEQGQKLGPYTIQSLEDKPLEPGDMVLTPINNEYKAAHSLAEFSTYFKSEGIYYPTSANTGKYFFRFPAFLIDVMLLTVIVSILAVIFFPQYVADTQFVEGLKTNRNALIIIQIAGFITLTFYNAICESGRMQGSIGKYVFGLVVVDDMGYSLTFKQAFIRNLYKIVYELSIVIGAIAYLGYLAMIWTERHQAMHDQFAHCFIVKKERLT